MELIWGVLVGIIIYGVGLCLHRAGFGIGAWREYRAGKAVDETVEWQAFKDSFEVKK